MGTAHSSHPMTSPNHNNTIRILWKTTRKSIKKKHNENQITMDTAHSSHPITLPNLSKTMHVLWKITTNKKSIKYKHNKNQITMDTTHSTHPIPNIIKNLYKTIHILYKTNKLNPPLMPPTANHIVHSSFSTECAIWENKESERVLNEMGTRATKISIYLSV